MKNLFVLFVVVVELSGVIDGFSNRLVERYSQPFLQQATRTISWLATRSSSSSDSDRDDDDEKSKVERVRKQLESLLGSKSLSSSTSQAQEVVDVDELMDPANSDRVADLIPKAPPLTSAERDRRLAEIEVLKALVDSDEPLQDLWDLWFSERGRKAKERLEEADLFMTKGQVLAAEKMLKQIIQEFGVYWVEPINRLATLLYLNGRLEESYQLCLVVLHLRPWHFGALSGMVAVSIGLGKRETARKWAEKRLPSRVASSSFPPFAEDGPSNPRRKEWVNNSVKQAQEALDQLEYQTQKDFGKPEKYYKNKRSKPSKIEDDSPSPMMDSDEDAWQ